MNNGIMIEAIMAQLLLMLRVKNNTNRIIIQQ